MGCINTTSLHDEAIKLSPAKQSRPSALDIGQAVNYESNRNSMATRDLAIDEEIEFADHVARKGYSQTQPMFSSCSMTAANRIRTESKAKQLDIILERMYRCESNNLAKTIDIDFDEFEGII